MKTYLIKLADARTYRFFVEVQVKTLTEAKMKAQHDWAVFCNIFYRGVMVASKDRRTGKWFNVEAVIAL